MQGRENGDRVDRTLVENTQDQINDDQRGDARLSIVPGYQYRRYSEAYPDQKQADRNNRSKNYSGR